MRDLYGLEIRASRWPTRLSSHRVRLTERDCEPFQFHKSIDRSSRGSMRVNFANVYLPQVVKNSIYLNSEKRWRWHVFVLPTAFLSA
jgi:hypothetical protein